MQRRTAGGIPSAIAKSNAAAGGAVSGADIGDVLPGVLQSLQESAAATMTPKLYYPEKLGAFNFPSYQTVFGIHNSTFLNINRFGEQGETYVEKDVFWKGPCMLKFTVDLPFRFVGPVQDYFNRADSLRVRPQLFYSWGAGYAAMQQAEINLGGAGTYRIDRYANFMGVMASCYSQQQRYILMKMSGGGVMCQTAIAETLSGVSGNTAEYATIQNGNYLITGDVMPPWDPTSLNPSQCLVANPYLPVRDNWVVCLKTPHTNFHNCHVRRKPIDTNILSENFNIKLITAQMTEFCDTGTGFQPLAGEESVTGVSQAPWQVNRLPAAMIPFLDHFRQYENYMTAFTPVNPANWTIYFTANEKYTTIKNVCTRQVLDMSSYNYFPTSDDLAALGNPKPSPMNPNETPNIKVEHIVSSMRLTNPMLGAYDVLKGRTDQAVYYPFQHLTSQAYFPVNPTFKTLTMQQLIDGSHPELLLPQKDRTYLRQTINIPVNPLTAMYIMVFREKDRQSNAISKTGSFSPSLFWQGLFLPRYQLTYGAEALIRKDSFAESMTHEIYENCSPICIPYKGGACTRAEILQARNFTTKAHNGIGVSSSQGLFFGVDRTAYMYEIALVDSPPMKREEMFQQTPSFEGEQLNFDFIYEPTLHATAGNPGCYDTATDLSFLDVYPPNAQGAHEVVALYNNYESDANRFTTTNESLFTNCTRAGIPADQKGFNLTANPWVLNNGNLLIQVVYAQNALWQMNPNFSKLVFARG
jgi:hypothetical protein